MIVEVAESLAIVAANVAAAVVVVTAAVAAAVAVDVAVVHWKKCNVNVGVMWVFVLVVNDILVPCAVPDRFHIVPVANNDVHVWRHGAFGSERRTHLQDDDIVVPLLFLRSEKHKRFKFVRRIAQNLFVGRSGAGFE